MLFRVSCEFDEENVIMERNFIRNGHGSSFFSTYHL